MTVQVLLALVLSITVVSAAVAQPARGRGGPALLHTTGRGPGHASQGPGAMSGIPGIVSAFLSGRGNDGVPSSKVKEAISGALPEGFPVISKWADGVAQSKHTLDQDTARSPEAMREEVTRYIDELGDFQGAYKGGKKIDGRDVRKRELILTVPRWAMAARRGVLRQLSAYAREHGVAMRTRPAREAR